MKTYYHPTQDNSTDLETGYILGLPLMCRHYKPEDGQRVQPIVSTEARGVYYVESPMYYHAPVEKSAIACAVDKQILQARYKIEQLEVMLGTINRP